MKRTSLFIFIILSFSSIGQILPKSVYSKTEWDEKSPECDVVSINCEYIDQVQKMKKLELGIGLNGEVLDRVNAFLYGNDSIKNPINPFLQWDLNVVATFQLDKTKITKTRPAFYYQEFTRDPKRNDWNRVMANPYPMRIRFAPPIAGKWNVHIAVIYKDETGTKQVIQLPHFSITALENEHQGFVKVARNNKNLERNGKVIMPIGHNLAGPYNGVETYGGDPTTTNKRAQVDDWMSFQDDVKRYVKEGGKFIKLIQLPYSSLLEFEKLGDYSNRLHYAWEQDKIMDLCEQNDVLVHFNLMFQNPIMKFSQYGRTIFDFGHWDGLEKIVERDPYPPYCYYTRDGKEPYEMFFDSVDLEYHKQRMRYYYARYGYSPQIYNWEILSEPWHLNESFSNPNYYQTGTLEGHWNAPFEHPDDPLFYKVHNALINYHDVISTYIKQELDDKEHLIGITIQSGGASYPWGHEDVTLDESIHLKNVDLIGVNRYALGPDRNVISKNSKNNETPVGENSEFHLANRIHQMCNKPVIYSECGTMGSCNDDFSHKTDVMTFAFNGIAGFHMWSGYIHSEDGTYDERRLWKYTIKAQNFLNQDLFTEVLNGNWTQGRQAVYAKGRFRRPSKEHQYYVAESGEKAVGYIRNRTINHKTVANKECQAVYPTPYDVAKDLDYKKGGKLEVTDLKKGRYYVTWYNEHGEQIEKCEQKAKRSGRMKKLYHPILKGNPEKEEAVYWYSIEKKQD